VHGRGRHEDCPLASNTTVRQGVRGRDASFGPRSEAGKEDWDMFMTLAETTRKLGVSFYAYLRNRIRATHAIPPLANLITQPLSLCIWWIPRLRPDFPRFFEMILICGYLFPNSFVYSMSVVNC